LRIIIGASSFDADRHAQEMLRAKRKRELREGNGPPIGVVQSLAKFMHICDDCAQTFWNGDEWDYTHTKCPGAPERKTGFSPN
jgi:uncharacterized protein with PIN domain